MIISFLQTFSLVFRPLYEKVVEFLRNPQTFFRKQKRSMDKRKGVWAKKGTLPNEFHFISYSIFLDCKWIYSIGYLKSIQVYFLKGKSEILEKKVFEPKGHRHGSAFKMQNITFRNLALSALKNPQLIMTSHIIWFRKKKKNHFYPLATLVLT